MYTIGVDVGGTYTDLVATDETGRTIFAKSPSTPADQSIGVMAGLEELARRLGVTRGLMLSATDRLVPSVVSRSSSRHPMQGRNPTPSRRADIARPAARSRDPKSSPRCRW